MDVRHLITLLDGGTTEGAAQRAAPSEAEVRLSGRYTLLRKLGEGGMGVVFTAFDEELDRRVAIKLLRAPDTKDGRGRGRMLREAKTLARLSHPNIVQVYDVGAADEQVFVAMEYVDGHTLRQWVEAGRRGWAEVLAMYVQAARGLAAAHAAGVVHRDFKPDNVLIGRDGRARVADFGLATILGGEGSEEPDDGRTDAVIPAQDCLTETGALIGTPVYMSLEQHMRRPADARSDQFSFCVALYEALYGVRPFTGRTRQDLALQALHGVVNEPPRDAGVPERVRRVILRGLSVEPAHRWPTMDAMIAELTRTPRRLRWRVGGGLALAGVAGLALAWSRGEPPCSSAAELAARAWGPEAAAAVHERIVASGVPHAEDVWASAQRRLDAYTGAWVEQHTAVCTAHQRGEQSEALFDRRMDCLRRRLVDVEALVRVLRDDVDATEHAIQAATRLTPLERCDDVHMLLAEVEPPADAATRATVQALQARLATVRALHQTASFAEGAAQAEGIVAEAEALGYRPLSAEARLWHGRLAMRLADYAAASSSLLAAWWSAQASRDDPVAIEAALTLGELAGLQRQGEPGRVWAGNAQALIDRQGGEAGYQAQVLAVQGRLRELEGRNQEALSRYLEALKLQERVLGAEHLDVAQTLVSVGRIYSITGDQAEAQRYFERGLALHEKILGAEHPATGGVLNSIASAYARAGAFAEAEAHFTRALAVFERALGPTHPILASALGNLANVQLSTGRYDRAIETYQRALGIKEAALGPDDPGLTTLLNNLGQAHLALDHFAAAEAQHRRALAILERAHGRDHSDVALALGDLAVVHTRQRRFGEARAGYREALAVYERLDGPEQMPIARLSLNFGEALREEGAVDEARVTLQHGIALWERLAGPDHHEIADALLELAVIDRGERRYTAAVASIERALVIRERAGLPAPAIAAARFELGRTLWEGDLDRARGLRLVRAAAAEFDAGADGHEAAAAELRAWLSSHVQGLSNHGDPG